MGATLTLVMPVNHESDSVDQIQRLTDQFGKQCSYVVVRNAAHSDSFALFESSEVRANSKTNSVDGKSPCRLQDWLVEALNAQNLTITAAVKHPRIQPSRPSTPSNVAAEALRRNRIGRGFVAARQVNPCRTNEPPNFDEEFDEAVAEWRDKHRLREDDAVMLLVELFRIHQRHWDEIRRRIPLRAVPRRHTKLGTCADISGTVCGLAGCCELERRTCVRGLLRAPPLRTIAGLLAGYLIGRSWP